MKLSMCFNIALKAYGSRVVKAPRILNLDTRLLHGIAFFLKLRTFSIAGIREENSYISRNEPHSSILHAM